jgi:hypothetical protein
MAVYVLARRPDPTVGARIFSVNVLSCSMIITLAGGVAHGLEWPRGGRLRHIERADFANAGPRKEEQE